MTRYAITAGTEVLTEADAQVLSRHSLGVRDARYRNARYRKYFVEMPTRPAVVVVARDDNGAPVGMAALHQRRLLVDGVAVQAAVAGDFVVVPAHRALGLAIRIQRSLLEAAAEAGIELIVGQPNDTAKAVLLRLGYRVLAERERAVRFSGRGLEPASVRQHGILIAARGFDAILGTFGPERWLRGQGDVAWADRFGAEFEPVWSASARASRVVSERTAEILNWRYELGNGSIGRFRILSCRDGNAVCAYAVIEDVGSVWRILEILGVDRRSQAILLAETLDRARCAGAAALVVSSFAMPETSTDALRKLHFLRRRAPRALVARGTSDTMPHWATDAAGWTFMVGDLDP